MNSQVPPLPPPLLHLAAHRINYVQEITNEEISQISITEPVSLGIDQQTFRKPMRALSAHLT